jgi:hypothetical protein
VSSTKGGEFFEQRSNCQLFKRSAPRSLSHVAFTRSTNSLNCCPETLELKISASQLQEDNLFHSEVNERADFSGTVKRQK